MAGSTLWGMCCAVSRVRLREDVQRRQRGLAARMWSTQNVASCLEYSLPSSESEESPPIFLSVLYSERPWRVKYSGRGCVWRFIT